MRLLSPVAMLWLCSCLEPTQVTFEITSDLPCAQIQGATITVGLDGETEKAMPTLVTHSCSETGARSSIGTYAVKPGMSSDALASFKVVIAAADGVDVERDCTAERGYQGCVVARRRFSFIPHRSVKVPVQLFGGCRSIQCDSRSVCDRAGHCTGSLLDTEGCQGDECNLVAPKPTDGVPCFNNEGSPLFCAGETNWCTRDTASVKACSEVPVPVGLSYQCRSARDCGAHLRCVAPGSNIIGQCIVDATVNTGERLLCTPGDQLASCGANMACVVDAGMGFLSCGKADGGTLQSPAPDAGSTSGDAGAWVGEPCDYSCTVTITGTPPTGTTTSDCVSPVNVTETSNGYFTADIDLAPMNTTSVQTAFTTCNPTGWVFHFSNSISDGWGVGPELQINTTNLLVYGNLQTYLDDPNTGPIFTNLNYLTPACENHTLRFSATTVDSDVPSLNWNDATYMNFNGSTLWHVGLNRTVGDSSRVGTGLTQATICLRH